MVYETSKFKCDRRNQYDLSKKVNIHWATTQKQKIFTTPYTRCTHKNILIHFIIKLHFCYDLCCQWCHHYYWYHYSMINRMYGQLYSQTALVTVFFSFISIHSTVNLSFSSCFISSRIHIPRFVPHFQTGSAVILVVSFNLSISALPSACCTRFLFLAFYRSSEETMASSQNDALLVLKLRLGFRLLLNDNKMIVESDKFHLKYGFGIDILSDNLILKFYWSICWPKIII